MTRNAPPPGSFSPHPVQQGRIPMADARLSGKKVAVLATDGFEQVELTEPVAALKEAGAQVEVVAPKAGRIQGFKHHDKGETVAVDRDTSQSLARNNPWHGRSFTGAVHTTVLRGRVTAREGAPTA